MNKEETIARYGEAAYEKIKEQSKDWYAQHHKEGIAKRRAWYAQHSEESNASSRKWRAQHPEEVKTLYKRWAAANQEKIIAKNQEHSRKGGKYYEKHLEYQTTGLQGERERMRKKHNYLHRAVKQATPNSVFHHEWIPGTAKYRGVALVEKKPHEKGVIKVIKILEGAITLFTEKEIAKGGM